MAGPHWGQMFSMVSAPSISSGTRWSSSQIWFRPELPSGCWMPYRRLVANQPLWVLAQFLRQPVLEELTPRTASVTVGLIEPGVHFGSGNGNPLRVWTRHGVLFAALPSGRDACGFTDSTGQSAQVTLAAPPASSGTSA